MLKLVTIEVFIVFVIIAFVLGLILGVFFMCCFIQNSELDKADELHGDYFNEDCGE